jgi:hypothetical protein
LGVPAQAIGEAGLWLAALLTLVTGWDYLARTLHLVARRGPPDETADHGRVLDSNATAAKGDAEAAR